MVCNFHHQFKLFLVNDLFLIVTNATYPIIANLFNHYVNHPIYYLFGGMVNF